MTRPLALLLALALSVGLLGCGNNADKKNSYINAVQLNTDRYKNRFDQIERQLAGTSTAAEDRKTLGDFTTATTAVIKQLEAIKPPADVKDLHGQLIEVYKSYLLAINTARKELKTNDVKQQKQARTDLSSAIEPINSKYMEVISNINDQLRK